MKKSGTDFISIVVGPACSIAKEAIRLRRVAMGNDVTQRMFLAFDFPASQRLAAAFAMQRAVKSGVVSDAASLFERSSNREVKAIVTRELPRKVLQ